MTNLVDEKRLEDMHRWHWAEGGLDNRHNAIGDLIHTLSLALKVVAAAQTIPTVINDAVTVYAPDECDKKTREACYKRRLKGGGTLAYFVDARTKLEAVLAPFS